MLSALLLPLCLATACTRDRGDVLLIVVDTLRADRVSLVGGGRETTPHIDRFFEDGAVYLRAYSTEASTSPSVVSLLSGRLPQEHGVRLFFQLLPAETALLPDLLPDSYQTAGFVSNIVLTDEALGLADRFDHFDDFVDERESERLVYERRAERTADAAIAWLEDEADADRPLFLFVHFIDPHTPYDAPGPWRRHFDSDAPHPIDAWRVPPAMRDEGSLDGNEYVARYDSEVAYTDASIGRLLQRFDALRSADDALVILTADHGESMMEHEAWFAHGYHVYDEIVRVPLLVRGPGVERARVRTPVSGVDVAGTILAFAGAAAPPSLGGADLRAPSELDPRRVVFVEARRGRQVRGAVSGRRKVVLPVERGGGIGEGFSFDLEADPAERDRRPLADDDPLARSLRRMIESDPAPEGVPERYRAGIRIDAPKVAPGVSEDDLERLRRLGYVE